MGSTTQMTHVRHRHQLIFLWHMSKHIAHASQEPVEAQIDATAINVLNISRKRTETAVGSIKLDWRRTQQRLHWRFPILLYMPTELRFLWRRPPTLRYPRAAIRLC